MSVASYSIWSTIVLLGILLLIPASVWLVKRFSNLNFRDSANLRVVESLSIGQRERLLVVHTGDQYLLIGSTAQQLSLLNDLPCYVEAPREKRFGVVLKEAEQHAN